MKIGLLAYHSACNFGAFLQLLSTIEYMRKNGDEPKVINWIPLDLEKYYEKLATSDVRELFSNLRDQFFPLTSLCRTSEEVAVMLENEGIDAVVVGSDAVCQHHPFRERCHFHSKRLFYVSHPTSDRMFPNPFWGSFNQYLTHPIPIAMISGSSQDSKFKYIHGRKKKQMTKAIKSFQFLSVRDDWTQKMISYLTDGKIVPQITPDPVFAFNYNAYDLIPSKEEILNKFSLPDKYFLISFKSRDSVNQEWITNFESISEIHDVACVKLRYAGFDAYGKCKYSVSAPLSPIDWYGLIKYSCGYVGNNMHPIVVSLHNGIPFYSFDTYGLKENEKSSKIYHVLKKADLLEYRTFTKAPNYSPPKPQEVVTSLLSFDCAKANRFSQEYYLEYKTMMDNVMRELKK